MVVMENIIEKKRKDDILPTTAINESSFDLVLAF